MRDMYTMNVRELYDDAIWLNVKAVSTVSEVVLAFNLSARASELFDAYNELLHLSRISPCFEPLLVMRGDRNVAERFVDEFKPRIPVLWSPKASERLSSQLELWVAGELRRKFFTPIPESEVVRELSGISAEKTCTSDQRRLTYYREILDIISFPEHSALLILVLDTAEAILYKVSYEGELLQALSLEPHFTRLLSVKGGLGVWAPLTGILKIYDPLSLHEEREISLRPALGLEYLELQSFSGYLLARAGEFLRVDEELTSWELLSGSRTLGFLDGRGATAKISWPLALARNGVLIFFLDSLNYSVRALNVITGEVRTLAGRGEVGIRDGKLWRARFSFLRDIELLDDLLVVVDEEHLGLRVIDRQRKQVISVPLPQELESVRALRRVCKAPGVGQLFITTHEEVHRVAFVSGRLEHRNVIFSI